jgi:hypothetical protein
MPYKSGGCANGPRMAEMASSSLAEQVKEIKSALDRQSLQLERILTVLQPNKTACENKYLPIPQPPYIMEIETFSKR